MLRPWLKPEFIGLSNYVKLLTSPTFTHILYQTFGFVVTTLTLELVIGFALALILNKGLRGTKLFRVIFSLPLMIAPVVAGLQWRWLYADQYGVINYVLSIFGIKGPLWLASPWGARAAVLIANLWLATPFVVLVLLAGLSSLPHEPFEAARIDGARNHQIFWYIMLPLLRPSLLIILVVRLTDALRVFDIVYILTQGGPGGSTEVVSTHIYKEVFTRLNFAEGAAASFIMVAIMMVISLVCVKLLRPKEGGA